MFWSEDMKCVLDMCVCFSAKWIDLLQWRRLLIGLSVSLTVSRKRSVSHYHVLPIGGSRISQKGILQLNQKLTFSNTCLNSRFGNP